ncbi:hypothetical protein SBE55_19720 [Mycolicibacterium sp. 141076]|jgi:hypothetical protein|uniref:Alanine and proline rich membrane protein n=1 Tax=Mycolicibacter arupensis TaxID=342002 RepID=A0A5C7XKH3_9MYCO|nr:MULTISPECIES: hypothetical protein [Mycobacteriaceae]SHW05357.1 putative alanine and proline rich membrane protein [Mycobacteroides abscessus subsp. abscessus]MDX1880033.1 hypothetical protein [Mycolicibacterium sp. 141076]RUP29668.1 MAG: hypothetical protein EKK51_19505 [Mycolicibacterium sp.]TXI49848.1 MAG: hypothetical protein E6Q54_22140 [Mycolicibacter arupensis]UCZ58442.1 hypothetical protein LHJ73_16820 [Mycolicibacterium phocaicum]
MAEDEKTEDKTTTLSKAAKDTDETSGSTSVTQIIAIAAVVIGLIAVAVGGYALYAVKHQAKTYTEAEQDTAKIALCDAMKTVSKGIAINTNLAVPGGPDDTTGALAVAANARLALITGGQYLLNRIDPAAPADLATAARKYANTLLDIGAAATAGSQTDDPQQKVRLDDAGADSKQISDICK